MGEGASNEGKVWLPIYINDTNLTRRKPPSESIAKLKRRLWPTFSKYIRLREADFKGYARCVTCNKAYPWQRLQAGHFVPGRRNSILYDERNCHQQCYICNIVLKGNPRKYEAYMQARYGQDVIDELDSKNDEMKQFTPQELVALIQLYKDKLKP